MLWQLALGGIFDALRPHPGIEDIDWAYHKQVVDLITGGLRSCGVSVIVEVDLRSDDGKTARAGAIVARQGPTSRASR